MIAAAYLRKSNDEGERSADVKSVAVQRVIIETFAAQRGLTLDERYIFTDDGISGAEFKNRPGLQALLASLDPVPPFQSLIVVEQSRLGRETLDTLVVIRRIEEAGVAIWSATEGRKITMADDTGEIMAMLDSWRDTSERRKTITRVRNAAFKRHDAGYVAGGVVYGYCNERLPGAGKQPVRRVADETQAAVVRRIFEMTRDGLGLTRIASQLNAEGVPAPRQMWATTGVREILHRDLYRGVEVFGRVRRGRVKGKKVRIQVPESEWKRREDESLRIVTDELWQAAHAQVQKNAATLLRKTNGHLVGQAERTRGLFLLSNLLVCGATIPEGATRAHDGRLCGEPLIALQRGRNLRRVYVCRGRREKGPAYCSNTTGVPLAEIHGAVVSALRETFSAESDMAPHTPHLGLDRAGGSIAPATTRPGHRSARRTPAQPGCGSILHSRADLRREQIEQLEHPPEVIAAEVDHQVREAEALVLAEEVHDRLRALLQKILAQGEAERERDGLPGPPGSVGDLTQPPDTLTHLRRRLARRVPAVGERDDPAEGARAVTADPDGRVRLLHRLGREAQVTEAVELALEARVVRRPQLLEDAQHLVGLTAAGVERRTQRLQLLLPPADAHAADQAPARQRIDRRQHLGHHDGMTVSEDEHRRPQTSVVGAHRCRGEHGHRLEVRLVGRMRKPAARIAGRAVRDDDVVADPERRHPTPLGLAREGREGLARGHHGELTADVHVSFLRQIFSSRSRFLYRIASFSS